MNYTVSSQWGDIPAITFLCFNKGLQLPKFFGFLQGGGICDIGG